MALKLSIGRFVIAACLVAIAWHSFIYMYFSEKFYRQQIPAEVEVTDLVYSDSGIRGSCGAAIFELAPRLKARLSTLGLRALTESSPSKASESILGISKDWKETPYVYGDNESPGDSYWALTLSCTWLGDKRRDEITSALSSPGSFFRSYNKGVVLVVPSAGLVAYLFFG